MLRNFSFIDNTIAGCAHPAGSGSCDGALEELKEKGIRAIVSLDEEGLPLYVIADHGFHYLHLPIPDFGSPTPEQMNQFFNFVDREQAEGNSIAVHCGAGYGRTGTALACYLVRKGQSPDEAIRQVRAR